MNSARGAESKNPGGAHRTNALQAFSTKEPEHKIFRRHGSPTGRRSFRISQPPKQILPGMFFRVVVCRRRMMILHPRPWRRTIGSRVGMNIGGAIRPGAAPRGSADDNCVRTPRKSRP